MKKLIFLLIPLFLCAACEKDKDVNAVGNAVINATIDGQVFSSGSQIGVYLDYANGNIPFLNTADGRFTGVMPTGKAGRLYAYSPYDEALGKSPKQVHFNLEILQASASNVVNNHFLIADPVSVGNLNNPMSLDFHPVTAAMDFAITVPSSGDARRIESLTLHCDAQGFYIQALADLTQSMVSYAARGAVNSRSKITWSNSVSGSTAAGSTLNARLIVFPDDYSICPITVVLVTDDGNYSFEWSPGLTLGPGESVSCAYTLKASDWYDPAMHVVTATALDAPDLESTPVEVDLSALTALGLTPATIVFTPDEPGTEVTYTITAGDITAGSAVVAKGAGDHYLQPQTAYVIRIFDDTSAQIAISNVTTKEAMDISKLVVVTALDAPNPVSVPVVVTLDKLTAINLVPATIVFTPTGAGNPVIYTITAADLFAKVATVSSGAGGEYLQSDTEYDLEVFTATNGLIATANVTTKSAMDMTDILVAMPGTDLKAFLEGTARKTKVYLPPGTYSNTSSSVIITKDLILFGSDPATTIVNSNQNLVPRGTISTIDISGITWKGTGAQIFRPATDMTSGSTLITSLNIHDMIVDFSGVTTEGSLIYARARFSEGGDNTVKMKDILVDNIIYVGAGTTGSTDHYAIFTVGGSDFLVKLETITVRNSTFANVYNGLIYLPAGNEAYPMPATNDGINPKIMLTNNTFYRIGCGLTGTIPLVFLGTNGYSFPNSTVGYKNNILIAGPNNQNMNLVNCADAYVTTTLANFLPLYENNWGLSGQTWMFRNSAANIPSSQSDRMFVGTATAFFENPQNNPLTAGTSLRVTGTDVKGAGDPRWF